MAGIDALLRIMARLRDPDGGCPWDLEQDFASISPHTIEEAYEVDHAIATGDLEALRDELGDLLFQVVFQAHLAQEQGAFDFAAVVDSICAKLVRRHPHVFAEAAKPADAAAQVAHWESIKATERAASPQDPFAGIPRSLPALTRSAKIAGRIERLRADAAPAQRSPAALEAAFTAIVRAGARIGAMDSSGPLARDAALRLVGEGIRAWVELARQLAIDPEQALRALDDEAIENARLEAHQAGNPRHR